MPPEYFPLRWESTGDQWWYASPIDWAAANGLYNVVRELLRLDTNLLIKLTSLRRIRRLETVWDDEAQFEDVARCRSQVAQKLLLEGETKTGRNSLVRAGYGGWLLYTAASAGDIEFVKRLLDRDPLLVFGEGEYGVTDMLYAASRSKNSEVFRLLFDFAMSPGSIGVKEDDNGEQNGSNGESVFKSEMMSRAVHASARGGNVEILKELLRECSDISMYRDLLGSTLMHSASARGQVEVVKYLISSFDIISAKDNQGNTALHVAAHRGFVSVMEVLIASSPSLAYMVNKHGDTFLHLAVAGFRTPGFRRMDRQIELMKQLVSGNIIDTADIINIRNEDGRTALHVAVSENIQTNLVELLMTTRYINVNIRDNNNMTPLDLLRRMPRSASSEIMIKQLISAGGISDSHDNQERSALLSHLKEGLGGSPGTSFRIPDAEIFLYTGIESIPDTIYDSPSPRFEHSRCLSEVSEINSSNSFSNYKTTSLQKNFSGRLKFLFRWPGKRKDRKSPSSELGDNESDSLDQRIQGSGNSGGFPIPLRQQYGKQSSLPNNKRVLSYQDSFPSPYTRKKFTSGLMHGVIQPRPHFMSAESFPSSYSGSPALSPVVSADKRKDRDVRLSFSGNLKMSRNLGSFNRKLMNQYLCFGAQSVAVENSTSVH